MKLLLALLLAFPLYLSAQEPLLVNPCETEPCDRTASDELRQLLLDSTRDNRPTTNEFFADSTQITRPYVSGFMGGRIADASETISTETSLVQPPIQSVVVFTMDEGETLRETLERWVVNVGWQKLVWSVTDSNGNGVEIPIAASHEFNCGFAECLSQLKEAYKTANPPLYLQFDLRSGNRVLEVTQTHYRRTR